MSHFISSALLCKNINEAFLHITKEIISLRKKASIINNEEKIEPQILKSKILEEKKSSSSCC